MRRLTLAGQMAVMLAVCILIAQAVSFTLVLETRRSSSLDAAIIPAAQRLASAVARRSEGVPSVPEPAARMAKVSAKAPIAANATRLGAAESRVAEELAEQQIRPREVRAVHADATLLKPGVIRLAVELDDGQWLSVLAPGPAPLGPLIAELLLQAAALYVVLLLLALLLLRRSGRSLRRLADASNSLLSPTAHPPLPIEGPRDIRALIASFNAMEQRLSAMVREKNIMLGALGHDLRTPLTALRLEAAGIAEDDTREAMVGTIESMHAQFENILTLARFDGEAARAEFDLAASVAAVVDGYRSAGQPVRFEPSDAEITLVGNEEGLRQALRNLIDNALRYAGTAEVSLIRGEGEAIVAVADHGPGIAPARFAEAIAPFGRLEPSRGSGGHGLGLAIVEAVARLHGGRLELGTNPPTGLIARLVIPLSPPTAQRQSSRP